VTAPGTRRATVAELDHVELFAAAAERFAVAVAGCDLHVPVPGCPGWSTYDLVCHLGNVHAWAATIVETGAAAVEQNDAPRSRKARAVSQWYAGKAEDLYEVLRAADPQAACWNFAFGAGKAGFWGRRQLHETTMHQVDLDAAAGRDPEPTTEVCADGVDEVLGVFLPWMHRRRHPALSAPVCLVATDTDDAWTVSPRVEAPHDTGVPVQVRGSVSESVAPVVTGPPLVVARRHPSADRVEAPAEVLYRLLWKRCSVDDPAVSISGDRPRVTAFLGSRLVP
jgi:uncharacterized protein (TIGR03083 family)